MRCRQCFLCGSHEHTAIVCERGAVTVELRVGEWLTVYALRRFKTLSEAAKHYRVSTSGLSMALAGERPMPQQLLTDAGVSFNVRTEVVKPDWQE